MFGRGYHRSPSSPTFHHGSNYGVSSYVPTLLPLPDIDRKMIVGEKKWIPDTNFAYRGLEHVIDKMDIVLMSTVRQEFDKHKTSENKDLQHKARKLNRFIFENYDKFTHDVGDYNPEVLLGEEFSKSIPDNRIVACAKANGYGILTGDLNLYSTAKAFGIDVLSPSQINMRDENYTGFHRVYISNDDEESQDMLSRIYQNSYENVFDLLTNQYLLIYDKDSPKEFNEEGNPTKYAVLDKLRWDGERHVKLKLPDKNVYKPLNEEQECMADLLMNKDIPIKIISGGFGTGKTMAATKLGLHQVMGKGYYGKLMMIRNPIGDGEPVGFLPGDFDEKTEGFFESVTQHLPGGEQEAVELKIKGMLEARIPYYMKGLSIGGTFIMVDEAEDLNRKQFRLVGSRIESDSAVAFVGDVKQAEGKYRTDNGMLIAIETLKDDPHVGIVVLTEDVRSNASRVFGKM